MDARAQSGQPLGDRIVGQVRARYAVTQIQQHFGNAAHADPADAHEMDVFDGVLHCASASQISATCRVASGLASCRALSDMAASVTRSRLPISAASFSALRSLCCTSQAAPASDRNAALPVWWSSTAKGKGTSTAGTPAQASSATVMAPEIGR